jgi:DNA-binding NarL/FixJ family response regulator
MLENMRPFLYGAFLWVIMYTKNTNTNTYNGSGLQESQSEPVLSRREQEVSRLASSGLTNMQIADRLFISEATVKRHLATIFQKKGISSRREL